MKKSRAEGRKRVRACRKTFEAAIPPSCLVIADHRSARSLSVTRIYWNVINFDLFTSDYLNQIACYVPTNDDVSTVSVLANGSLERRSQMFVYRLSPFPFSLLAFFTLSPNREPVHRLLLPFRLGFRPRSSRLRRSLLTRALKVCSVH